MLENFEIDFITEQQEKNCICIGIIILRIFHYLFLSKIISLLIELKLRFIGYTDGFSTSC